MNPLSPIPVPPGHRWREFRIKVLPVLVFLAVAVMAVVTWNQHLGVPTLVGEVENLSVSVISTVSGHLVELPVGRFQKVERDMIVARLHSLDPEQLRASLLALEMDLKVTRARLALDERRNTLDYEQLRLDHLSGRVALAVARARLQQAESERQRVRLLHEEKVVSDSELELAVRDYEALQAEVTEQTHLVAALAQSLARLQPATADPPDSPANLIRAAIEAQEKRLLLLEGPVSLRSPAEGVISSIHHWPGENVLAGEPIVTLSPLRSERIVGYVRQPLRIVPKAGDRVRVRTRGPTRQVGESQVVDVGTGMQPISPTLQPRGFVNVEERGLPFLVSIPDGMDVYPGELVDVIFVR